MPAAGRSGTPANLSHSEAVAIDAPSAVTSATRVAFAGTPAFAEVALASLHAAGYTVPLVLTQPDRPGGRGMKLQPSAVKAFASARAIATAQPRSLRLDGRHADEAEAARVALEAARPDLLVVAAYGLILPRWVLAVPRLGCLNIHGSLLPRWRGAAPIHRAVEAGDTETGITIMQMDEGLDTGAMLLVERAAIEALDTTGRLHDRLATIGARLIVDAVAAAVAGTLEARPQPAEGVTYASKIDKAEAAIDWRDTAAAIERRMRAFDPFPGATAALDGETCKCWRGEVVRADGAPGTVLAVDSSGPVVAAGSGALRLVELQRPGGRRLPAAQFFQGRPWTVGMRLDVAN
jgi:methionyl-tRNA formyltransferase